MYLNALKYSIISPAFRVVFITLQIVLTLRGSSNGRTAAFEAVDWGSSP